MICEGSIEAGEPSLLAGLGETIGGRGAWAVEDDLLLAEVGLDDVRG